MKCLIYILIISLTIVTPSLALNNNNNLINISSLSNNTSFIIPLAHVNLTEENSYLNSINLTNPEYGIGESRNDIISQIPVVAKIAIISISISILLFIFGIIITRHRENHKLVQFYKVRAYTKKLKPDDFDIKKYPEYIRKSSHDTIINRIKEGEKKILVKGVTGLGKTRAIFEIIKELGLKTNYFVIIPVRAIRLPIWVPKDFFILKRRFILFFDDIDKYVSNGTEISGIINEFEKNSKNLIVLATCREEEYDILKKERINELFNIIEYDKLSTDDGIRLAKSVGEKFNPKEFDGTAGSIVLDENKKKEYYEKLNPSEKNILRAIKLLSLSNIFLPSEQLLMKVHKIVFDPNDNFNTYFIDLKKKKFIFSEKDNVSCLDFYLSKIVDDYPLGNQLFEHMLELREVLFELRIDENLFYLGNAFYFKEKYQDAITCFDKALEINPKRDEAWLNKGMILETLGKYYEAIKCFDKALEINPKWDEAWMGKGIVLERLGKYYDAITCFDKALEINPKRDEAWVGKGIVLERLGKYYEAITCFDKALEINPKNEGAWVSKGLVLDKSGKHIEAIKCFDKALEINPTNEGAWVSKGLVLDKSGKHIEAITCFDKALEINPKNDKVWLNKGIVLDTLGKYNEAITCFDKALEINPKMDAAWYNRACAYSITGDKEKALFDLRRAIEFDTSNKEQAKKEEDFKILWGDEDFIKLVA